MARVSGESEDRHRQDYYAQGRHTFLRLEEKGGKQRIIPCPHKLEEYVDSYLEVAGIANRKGTPLFRSSRARTKQLTTSRISRTDAYAMIRRRTEDACAFRSKAIRFPLESDQAF